MAKLTENEKNLIEKYLNFYKSLDNGTRVPKTEAQKHFVEVCRKISEAKTPHEHAYIKYLGIRSQLSKVDNEREFKNHQSIVEKRTDSRKIKNRWTRDEIESYNERRRRFFAEKRRRRKIAVDNRVVDKNNMLVPRNNSSSDYEKLSKKNKSKKRLMDVLVTHSDPND